MSALDWTVLLLTIGGIVAYGMWMGRQSKHSLQGYLLADQSLPWYHVLLSVMATQASAITFLSAPGQAYTDGMRFVQFYLGLPLAMVILSVTFIPQYFKWKVFTAYQYLEERFDAKTRVLTSLFFLIPRALSTGVTIAAPSIILSVLLGWDLTWTNVLTASLVTIYCMSGGSKAISYTQLLQMGVVLMGMIFVGIYAIHRLPDAVGWKESMSLAGSVGKVNLIDWKFDLNNRYNIWSGIIGGFFLQLSYFGTDQSQVGRYLSGKNANQSRMGLLLNGFLKIPMQFGILMVGLFVFVFYFFQPAPLFFNRNVEQIWQSQAEAPVLEQQRQELLVQRKSKAMAFVNATTELEKEKNSQALKELEQQYQGLKTQAQDILRQKKPGLDSKDTNYIFLHFIIDHLPLGMVGFLLAMILLASMGSMASAFGSLTSTSVVDIYQRFIQPQGSTQHYWWVSKLVTLAWGLICLYVAQLSTNMGSLIEVVNILGSWFYGTVLGIFISAFYFKKIGSNAVFYAGILAELLVITAWYFEWMAFLWLNVLGCVMVVILALLFQGMLPKSKATLPS